MNRLACFAFMGALALGQNLDYFPLQSGNQWIYQGKGPGAGSRTIEVGGTVGAGKTGAQYFVVSGFAPEELRLRRTSDNKLVKLDPATGSESVVMDFSAPDGAKFGTSASECQSEGIVESRTAKYSGPIGQFDETLEVSYRGRCADAGITGERYLAFIGMLQRVEQSFAGPRTYDLVYARVGGVTQVAAPHISVSLTLDQRAYRAGEVVSARLALRNTQTEPLVLDFASSQEFDLAITVEGTGREVARWSADRMFVQALHTVSVTGEKNWSGEVKLPEGLPKGRYVAEMHLTAGAKRHAATLGFDVVE